jgi:isocitrate lyase
MIGRHAMIDADFKNYYWNNDPSKNGTRWRGIKRDYTAGDVMKLQGSYPIRHTIAELMSTKLWDLMSEEGTRALGASTPAQAVQMVRAGLTSIYLSGWQVAADVNGHMYPDQSLYPCDKVPDLVEAINNALLRQDQIDSVNGNERVEDWLAPIVADAEAGFGGALNAYEFVLRLCKAGAAGVHFEDQLSSEKKCGHLGGKVLVPTSEFITKLKAARLAADVAEVPMVIIARTDANSARLLTSDIDPRDTPFILSGARTPEGFYEISGGIDMAIARGLAYAPYADAIWCETGKPDIEEARKFAAAIHAEFPGKLLAYNCSPSFNWSANLSKKEIMTFQDELMAMGYKFQFITLAGFHSLNEGMFNLARNYKASHMSAYDGLQRAEFRAEKDFGYDAAKHQSFVGTGFFDEVKQTLGDSTTSAMADSTETEQF